MHPLFNLPFMTFFAVLILLLGALGMFLTRASNRHAAEAALVGTGQRAPMNVSNGALPEIAGVLGFAVLAMALLAVGRGYGTY